MTGDAGKTHAMRQIYVEQAFTMPADQNYLLARIAFSRSLIFDGYWAAAQATEKYLKAALLLNGFDALDTHELVGLFDKLKLKVPLAIIPDEFLRFPNSETLQEVGFSWGSNSIRYFVSHLGVYGSPDNRYARNGYQFDFYVLPKLDQLIYFLRRNCRTLSADNPAHKDIANWKLGAAMPLETHTVKKEWAAEKDNQLVDDFLTGNAIWQSIISGGGVEVGLQPMMALQQSAYGAAVLSLECSRKDKIEFNKWLLSNVRLNKRDKASIRNEITRLETEDDRKV
ncbi:HEPN domain-containing protein [Neorhizobium galegae]|uniref:HEPN domain-containing protein n=1 Tax=Neorhizobium galegae TaxID=399 RepID=UPI0021023270|nr:HEPN domain-containing protein [Neorhizobium galegae]MCQ1839164.1 HEPN domain-containing protein [Neorhizobium galegae]